MSFRAQELYKKLVRKVGKDVPAEVMETVRKNIPNSKIVMGRAKRGIFAGRHIQFGNKISEDGGNNVQDVDLLGFVFLINKALKKDLADSRTIVFFRSRRTWKPNVQSKRLFSYIHDRHIRIKVTTHALRCIDKAGGIDEYLLKTPYRKMDTELGLLWKAKIEKMYEEFSNMEVGFFSREEESKIAKGFEEYKIAKRDARREARKVFVNRNQIKEGISTGDTVNNCEEEVAPSS